MIYPIGKWLFQMTLVWYGMLFVLIMFIGLYRILRWVITGDAMSKKEKEIEILNKKYYEIEEEEEEDRGKKIL